MFKFIDNKLKHFSVVGMIFVGLYVMDSVAMDRCLKQYSMAKCEVMISR